MKKKGMLAKFAALFTTIIILAVVMNYFCATLLSKNYVLEEKQNYIKSILDLAAHTMEEAGEDTLLWAEYCEENAKELDIRYDEDNSGDSGYQTENSLAQNFSKMSAVQQKQQMERITEKWIQYYDYVLDNYGLKYMYFVRVSSENDIVYIADGKPRDGERDGIMYRYSGDVDHYDEPLSKSNPVIWKLWNSGDKADIECELSNTEYGRTYRLWCPVVINGEVAGLLGANIDVSQVDAEIRESTLPTALWSCLFFAALLTVILVFLRKTIVLKIVNLDQDVMQYSRTKNPEVAAKIAQTRYAQDEIGSLAVNFSDMILSLENYMTELNAVTAEKQRIGAELDVAKNIQASMLPCIFPAFPGREEFDIYATMEPAKEVGGDFYDFFLVDEDHLAMVIADVSGKGVPAALFMVIAKTLLKNCTQTGLSPHEVLEKVNEQLCENNDAEMFVTVWLGILEISTGKLTCANAGHEYPVLRRGGADFELIKDRHGFVLAGMEGSRYKEYEIILEKGDQLYVYTDGVPEATNADDELYGADRMVEALNRDAGSTPGETLTRVKQDIDQFVGEAPQFDDITMLAIEIR